MRRKKITKLLELKAGVRVKIIEGFLKDDEATVEDTDDTHATLRLDDGTRWVIPIEHLEAK